MAGLLFVRFYSRVMYPFLKEFEGYYVESVELSKSLQTVRLRWASAQTPKEVEIPIDKFKQVHHLGHKSSHSLLSEHLPFHTFEAGFDHNKYEALYQTIWFQVRKAEQEPMLELLNEDLELSDKNQQAKREAVFSKLKDKANTMLIASLTPR